MSGYKELSYLNLLVSTFREYLECVHATTHRQPNIVQIGLPHCQEMY